MARTSCEWPGAACTTRRICAKACNGWTTSCRRSNIAGLATMTAVTVPGLWSRRPSPPWLLWPRRPFACSITGYAEQDVYIHIRTAVATASSVPADQPTLYTYIHIHLYSIYSPQTCTQRYLIFVFKLLVYSTTNVNVYFFFILFCTLHNSKEYVYTFKMENNKIVKFVIKSCFRKQSGETSGSIVHRGKRYMLCIRHVCVFKSVTIAPNRRLLIDKPSKNRMLRFKTGTVVYKPFCRIYMFENVD